MLLSLVSPTLSQDTCMDAKDIVKAIMFLPLFIGAVMAIMMLSYLLVPITIVSLSFAIIYTVIVSNKDSKSR